MLLYPLCVSTLLSKCSLLLGIQSPTHSFSTDLYSLVQDASQGLDAHLHTTWGYQPWALSQLRLSICLLSLSLMFSRHLLVSIQPKLSFLSPSPTTTLPPAFCTVNPSLLEAYNKNTSCISLSFYFQIIGNSFTKVLKIQRIMLYL